MERDERIKMGKLSNIIRKGTINPVRLILLYLAILFCVKSTFAEKKLHGTPMHKVELTQKGYIQVRNTNYLIYLIRRDNSICLFNSKHVLPLVK